MKWDSLPLDRRPEAGLLALRRALAVYANIRPIQLREPLRALSPLRLGPDTRGEFRDHSRAGRATFILASTRLKAAARRNTRRTWPPTACRRSSASRASRLSGRGGARRKVTSVDKANVLATSTLWRRTVTRMAAAEAPELTLDHLYVDNASMQIILRPEQFDVMLTSNLFGDILSDEASALVGSIGMVPSWSAGDGPPLVEPIHGTAPQLVGKDVANPSATIFASACCCASALACRRRPPSIERALDAVLADGIRTADIAEPGCTTVSGSRFTSELRARLQKTIAQAKSQGA